MSDRPFYRDRIYNLKQIVKIFKKILRNHLIFPQRFAMIHRRCGKPQRNMTVFHNYKEIVSRFAGGVLFLQKRVLCMTAQEILNDALLIVKSEISEVFYSTFFENQLKAGALCENILLLSVPTPLYKKQVEKHIDLLQTAVRSAAGDASLNVEILLNSDVEARRREIASCNVGPVQDQLNPAYTFENYVQGDNNRMAYAVSVAVGEEPGEDYNPLFIYGGTGLGKTHLMQAIGHYAHQMHPEMRICYITSENFINQMVTALQNHESNAFRERFRNVDLLLVDDIQFIAGKTSTENEFFHTFNDLKQNRKGIVMVSDRPPREIQNLEERLCSRFEGGMVIDIQKPDFETRFAILRKKAEYMKLDVEDDVLRLIAEHVDSNVREIEGCLTRISAHMRLSGQKVNVKDAERLLADVLRRHEHRAITVSLIQQSVADYFNITVEDLISPKRSREFNLPRQVAMYLCRDMMSQPFSVIGAAFGRRHHSTVMNAIENIEKAAKDRSSTGSMLDDLKRMINGEE